MSEIRAYAMRPSEAIEAIRRALRADIPVLLLSPPGIGKTEISRTAAVDEGYTLHDPSVATAESVDARGLMWIDNTGDVPITRYAWPEIAPRAERTVLFLDELGTADRQLGNALLRMVQRQPDGYRYAGQHRLPKDMRIIACSNQAGIDATTGYSFSSALLSRFAIIHLVPHCDDWLAEAARRDVGIWIRAFIKARPDYLWIKPERGAWNGTASPRSWMRVHEIEQHYGDAPAMAHKLICTTVGEGIAGEYNASKALAAYMPDPRECLSAPTTAPLPKHDDRALLASLRFAVVCAVASLANDETTLAAACTYAKRIGAEYQALLLRTATLRDKRLLHSRVYIDWACSKGE